MILKLLYIIYSKSAKITLSVCVVVGKLVCYVNGGKPVRFFLCVCLKLCYDVVKTKIITILQQQL